MEAAGVVRRFIEEVRSGKNLETTRDLMAERVVAHQVTSENTVTVERTPQNYADHVREMQVAYGKFQLQVTEFIAQGDRVYVRWRQEGHHVGEVNGHAPTGLPVVEIASAVYRVVEGYIVEYWIQIDRAGLEAQLVRNAVKPTPVITSEPT